MSILVYLVEHDRGTIAETTLGGMRAARDLAAAAGLALHVAVPGATGDDLVDEIARHGPEVVHQLHHELLDDYGPLAWAAALSQVADSLAATAIAATGTDRGNEVMAHVGALRDVAMVANCLTVTPEGDEWEMLRVRWGGSLHERTALAGDFKLVTFAPHVHEAEPAAGPAVVSRFTPLLDASHGVTVVRQRTETASGVTLATAPVVVSGGRGVGGPEGFEPLEALAARLGGVVGCSRVATNNGWRPHSDQVGQTGTVVAPDLYIACGISGAFHHVIGMRAADTVVAVNRYPDDGIFRYAYFGIVGDVAEVLSRLTAALPEADTT